MSDIIKPIRERSGNNLWHAIELIDDALREAGFYEHLQRLKEERQASEDFERTLMGKGDDHESP